jgi:predicted metal-dependent phosphoesterase TrpH
MQRACAQGVGTLAVTDHDSVSAWPELCAARPDGLTLISGIELSARWGTLDVHVVGLNVTPDAPSLAAGVEQQRAAREVRAERIAHKLARRRIPDPLAGARHHAGNAVIGRPHFAAHLVDCGAVPDAKTAFKRYLGNGKVGYVRTQWPEVGTVIDWIHAAGGQAVLAHPLKYTISASKRRVLVAAFKADGGDGLEVISGNQVAAQTEHAATLCRKAGLLASVGSDFHTPAHPWTELGRGLTLPRRLEPVWSAWS